MEPLRKLRLAALHLSMRCLCASPPAFGPAPTEGTDHWRSARRGGSLPWRFGRERQFVRKGARAGKAGGVPEHVKEFPVRSVGFFFFYLGRCSLCFSTLTKRRRCCPSAVLVPVSFSWGCFTKRWQNLSAVVGCHLHGLQM